MIYSHKTKKGNKKCHCAKTIQKYENATKIVA